MAEWLTTEAAARMLGTTRTTVRAMATRGELICRTQARPERKRWSIARESVDQWIAAHGRIDDRRQAKRLSQSHGDRELRRQLATAIRDRRELLAQVEQLGVEVAALKAAALQLRAGKAAVAEAEAHHAEVVRHLLDTLQSQAQLTDDLRGAIAAGDDALGVFLIPDTLA